jgi:hypothetical protein
VTDLDHPPYLVEHQRRPVAATSLLIGRGHC